MLTWKKTIAIVLASAGVFVSSAHAQLTLGQSTFPSDGLLDETGAFRQDSRPFSKPYRKEVRAAESTNNAVPPIAGHIISVPPTKPSLNSETFASQDLAPNQQVLESKRVVGALPSTSPASNSGLPTVIVRPPASDSPDMNDLTVNVEKIAGSNNHEFAVRLMVPNSVKVIEVTPLHDPNSVRNFKIYLQQQSNQESDDQQNGEIASIYSMPIAAPVHSASSFNAVQPPAQPRLPESAERPQMIPVKQQSPARNGFRKNPFFQPKDENQTSKKQSTAMVPSNLGPPVVLEAIEPPVVAPADQTQAKKASYRTTSSSAYSPRQVDGSASQMSYVASLESGSTIHSAMFGPNRMGLGDTGDFIICLTNPTAATINDLTVRLDVPSGFEVVVLDRVAKVNENAGTLTWHIPEVTPDQEHLIRYRVKSLVEGMQLQQIWIGSDDVDRQACGFETVVDVEHESAEAPSLPFESN